MALYVSASKRFRRVLAIAVVVGVVAFLLGWLIGRQQVPSIDERVSQVQTSADRLATGLERLGIEYEQVLAGTDGLDGSVITPLDDLRSELQSTMDRASWLSGDQRAAALDAIAGVRQSALDNDTLDEFSSVASDAAAIVRSMFGLAAAGA